METKACAWCGAPFYARTKLYKYCSEECATEAHREQARKNFRQRYANPEKHAAELERSKAYYRGHKEQKHAQSKLSMRRYRERNREKYNTYQREWSRKYRAQKKASAIGA